MYQEFPTEVMVKRRYIYSPAKFGCPPHRFFVSFVL
jgi:hypothetical protein